MKFLHLHQKDKRVNVITKEWQLREFIKPLGGDGDDLHDLLFELHKNNSDNTVIHWCDDPQDEGTFMWNTCSYTLGILYNALID